MTYTIYHNPRCSKSRQTLALLNERGIEPVVIEYLQAPPDATTLRSLLAMLGMAPRALLRRGEDAYRQLGLDDPTLPDAAIIDAMVQAPVLIERPIVVHEGRAVLGRPPENIETLLQT
ncbi:MAG: arsenate reductase (glutaredoxin) [Gammaproteobacteria bacterium]|nr:arsenate reductase (glutaredoxin) [Gammaproteobacteria bacterium]